MRLSLRLKLTLVSLILLAIPFIGFRFSVTLKKNLLESRKETLMFSAKAVASALVGRPDLFDRELFHSLKQGRDLYLFQLSNPMRLNGKTDDWIPEINEAEKFNEDRLLYAGVPYQHDSFHFKHIVGQRGNYLYALFLVTDDHVIYRKKRSLRLDLSDHLQIAIEDKNGFLNRYIITTNQPGWINGFLMPNNLDDLIPVKNETSIQGVWATTREGYCIEIRIPMNLIGPKLAFAIADVDNKVSRKTKYIIGTANPEKKEELGWLLSPSTTIVEILKTIARPHSRIRIIDKNRRVRASFGSLEAEQKEATNDNILGVEPLFSFLNKILTPVYALFTDPFPADFTVPSAQLAALDIQGIEEGLSGESSITNYQIADGQVEVMAAITPLTEKDTIMGAVIVEQTTNSILALTNLLIEESISFSILVFVLGGLGLLLFASRISSRIRKLSDQAARAISTNGQILDTIQPVPANDEIGDLSRTLSSMLVQMKNQSEYKEMMADNLEHEMRTPLAGVSASLKNIDQELIDPPERIRDYVQWALKDVQRLEGLLAAIRDATSLQEALDRDFREDFDLAEALLLWLDLAWKPAFSHVAFIFDKPEEKHLIHGDPDRIRQAIDKLIENGVSFHLQDTPIELYLSKSESSIELKVANQGPTIPEDKLGQIFNSMVSMRNTKSGSAHLGLGLYIVRTIIEHHGGGVRADNLDDGREGAVFTIRLPSAQEKMA